MSCMFNYCYSLTIKPNWIINQDTYISNGCEMFEMSPLRGTVLEKTFERYNREKANKDIKNTILALSGMRDKTEKKIPVPSGDVIRKIADYIDPDKISKTGKKDIEQEIWKERERKVYTNQRRETRREEEEPGGGGYTRGWGKSRKNINKKRKSKKRKEIKKF
jgi:hypothetical protein